MKMIRCNTPKGIYLIPLLPVAENRADYYSVIVDGNKKGSKEWQDEVDYAMNDSYEAIDWLLNNTDWEDWKDMAIKLNDNINVTHDDFWTDSSDFEIGSYQLKNIKKKYVQFVMNN